MAQADRVSILVSKLRDRGWEPGHFAGWDEVEAHTWYHELVEVGFQGKTLPLAAVVLELAAQRSPDTVRGIMYACVSMGWIPDTGDKSYGKVQRILNTLRKRYAIPFHWIVDNVRETVKPSSWTGLDDFADTVAGAYRKDFWAQLPEYVCVIVEKDTVAGRIQPVTQRYDVALHALRGFSSTSFAYEIGEQWGRIDKPINAYYIGDHDPSGREIETSLQTALADYSGRTDFHWTRLAVNPADFDTYNIKPLKPKGADTRAQAFIDQYGPRCAEVEAVPADALREMVGDAIEEHIPQEEWARLRRIELQEKDTWGEVMAQIREGGER